VDNYLAKAEHDGSIRLPDVNKPRKGTPQLSSRRVPRGNLFRVQKDHRSIVSLTAVY
jgi:hypothetical protein